MKKQINTIEAEVKQETTAAREGKTQKSYYTVDIGTSIAGDVSKLTGLFKTTETVVYFVQTALDKAMLSLQVTSPKETLTDEKKLEKLLAYMASVDTDSREGNPIKAEMKSLERRQRDILGKPAEMMANMKELVDISVKIAELNAKIAAETPTTN